MLSNQYHLKANIDIMETTEKIVEAYCRYVKGWFTLPNIKGLNQVEIDLLAIDTTKKNRTHRYHIETSVSISGGFSKLTDEIFSEELLKQRNHQAQQRRTMGYFIHRKFNRSEILDTINHYGLIPGNYKKIITTWGWKPGAKKRANKESIILWDFRDLMNEIDDKIRNTKTYFTDDTLRTIQLFSKANKK